MRDMSDSARNRRRKHLEELEPGERCKTDRSIFDVPLAPTAAWEQECVESDTGGTRSTRALEERIHSRRPAKITQPITIRGVPPTGCASGLPWELRQEHFERTFWLRRRARASGAPVLPPNEGGIEYAPGQSELVLPPTPQGEDRHGPNGGLPACTERRPPLLTVPPDALPRVRGATFPSPPLAAAVRSRRLRERQTDSIDEGNLPSR